MVQSKWHENSCERLNKKIEFRRQKTESRTANGELRTPNPELQTPGGVPSVGAVKRCWSGSESRSGPPTSLAPPFAEPAVLAAGSSEICPYRRKKEGIRNS